jgi:hypothetical protein
MFRSGLVLRLALVSVMALASLGLFSAPVLRAQDSTITIKDPAEFNAYKYATSQSDPKTKAAALEDFLRAYPHSVVKGAVLDALIDTYQSLNDGDKTLGAASRLLQVDPNNMKAIFISVFLKKNQCAKTNDPQICDDAAALARKGFLAPKPAGMSNADWKKLTAGTYPAFHSAIAFDLAVSRKDFKAAIAEYTAELRLYMDAQTQSGPGLQDTLYLAKAYSQPGTQDLVKAVWFYARAWNFAPASYKPIIEKSLDYYYRKYHGNLKGLDEVKRMAALTTFPPALFRIESPATPADQDHDSTPSTSDQADAAPPVDQDQGLIPITSDQAPATPPADQDRDPVPNAPDQTPAAPPANVHFGFEVRPVIQDDRTPLALTNTQGLVVVSVENGSLADTMGILAGDVILAVNGAEVSDMQHFSQLIHNGAVTTFNVWRKGKTLLLTVPQSF